MNPEVQAAYNEYQEKVQAARQNLWATMAPVLEDIEQKLTPHTTKLDAARHARMVAIAAADKALEEAEAVYAMEAAGLLSAQEAANFKLMNGLRVEADLLWNEYREKVRVLCEGAPKKTKKTKRTK